jgi:hypothetical protein
VSVPVIHSELTSYCQGFANAKHPWPSLPLPKAPELAWWESVIAAGSHGELQGQPLLSALENALPQLRLPQQAGISGNELYKALVLGGESFTEAAIGIGGDAPVWQQPEAMRLWISPHACGAMPVLHTPCRHDFVQLVRALAHRAEPVPIAEGVHAQAVSGLIHWGLINQFGHQSRAKLIVLHEAPYGSLPASAIPSSAVPGGCSEGQWLAASTKLRLEHELTHLATKRLLGEMRLNLLDELIADCMGMVVALGRFDAELFGRCLGIAVGNGDRPIAHGRWMSYTSELTDSDSRKAIELVMARARELQLALNQQPELLQAKHAMVLLAWLSRQRLDQPISSGPAARR